MQSGTRSTLPVAVALLVAVATPTPAQQTVVNFRTLQTFLPTAEVPGFVRRKPTGQTSSAMGMTSSEAKVVYERQAEQEEGTPTITVTVTDLAGNPGAGFAAMGFAMEVSEETDEGYRKTIKVQNQYKGLEEATTTPENKSCHISVLVGNRFIVNLEGYLTDQAALLHKLLESMKLAQLEKAGQAKG
jgi:hypothetical protein